jgi:hypothetical protein
MIRSHADVIAAYEEGRFHTQRFIKTGQSGTSYDGKWQDWAFQAGQPAYDARIGPVASLLPVVATKNDAIYFPDIPSGMERKLHKITMRPQANNASQATLDFMLYDLVAYYPLIDGDSTDPQDMDNTLTLPRYTDGEGLRLVMFNHVAPAVAAGRMLLEYTNSANEDKTLDVLVPQNGVNSICSGVNTVGTVSMTNINLPIDGTGIKRVNRVTYSIPPGGLHCLYLIKPLAQFKHYHDALLQADTSGVKSALEVDFALKDGWRMPAIKDGAHLAFFFRVNGGGRSDTFFGDALFIWG